MDQEKHREDYLNWDEFFMGVAMMAARRSKDPSSQVGACLVDDEAIPWGHGQGLDSKYLYVCHAEFNAVLNTRDGAALKGCTLYVTLFPCNECAKALIQVGVKKIVYLDDKYHDHLEEVASRRLLDMAGIPYEPYKGRRLDIHVE